MGCRWNKFESPIDAMNPILVASSASLHPTLPTGPQTITIWAFEGGRKYDSKST
jgi:hypothetical protein